MKEAFIIFIIVLVAVVAGLLINQLVDNRDLAFNYGSTVEGNDYNATTTPWDGINTSHYIKKGQGSLNSVIITKAGDTEFYLLDATNTPELIDAYATSSDMLAHFPANLAAGTYTFDTVFNDGLYLYVVAGNTGTSTITFR